MNNKKVIKFFLGLIFVLVSFLPVSAACGFYCVGSRVCMGPGLPTEGCVQFDLGGGHTLCFGERGCR